MLSKKNQILCLIVLLVNIDLIRGNERGHVTNGSKGFKSDRDEIFQDILYKFIKQIQQRQYLRKIKSQFDP
jgi:hypothetical protein